MSSVEQSLNVQVSKLKTTLTRQNPRRGLAIAPSLNSTDSFIVHKAMFVASSLNIYTLLKCL